MSWFDPRSWFRRSSSTPRLAPVVHLSDLMSPKTFATDPQKALLEAALLAQRARLVWAPGTLTYPEVLALARASEVLASEHAFLASAAHRDPLQVVEQFAGGSTRGTLKLERAMQRAMGGR